MGATQGTAAQGDRKMTDFAKIAADYRAASAAYDVSYARFDKVRMAFRAGKATLAEFDAAKAAHRVVQDAFDVANAAAADLPEDYDVWADHQAEAAAADAAQDEQLNLI